VSSYEEQVSPEEVEEACRALTELIAEGHWPNWQFEFQAEVARCRSR
jgi:hypothetical protein